MPNSPLVNLLQQRLAHWNRTHPGQQLDPQAVRAVGSQEGLSGGVGDHGTSFGFAQLHAGGALPPEVWARGPEYAKAWADSPEGIDYALSREASVAGGLTGGDAIENLVTRFERPANPRKEVAGAMRAYGLPAPGGKTASTSSPLAALASNASAKSAFTEGQIASLLGAQQAVGLTTSPMLMQLLASRSAAPATAAAPTQPRAPALAGAPIGTRSLAAVPNALDTRPGISVNPQILPDVEKIANQFGVKVNSGYRDPQRNQAVGGAPRSDHLSGNAVDFTGAPAALQALYRFAQGRFPYVEPMAQANDHVHISFKR